MRNVPVPRSRDTQLVDTGNPIEPPPAGTEDPIHELTQRCTDVLEMYVRKHPDLWLWMHRRWREPAGHVAAAPEPERSMFPAGKADGTDDEEVRT